MATKMTVRLPEYVSDRIRERSQIEGLSLNETVVRALEQGLAQPFPEDEWWRALGDLVARPPLRRFDPASLAKMHVRLNPGSSSILDDLEWTRGDATDEPEA